MIILIMTLMAYCSLFLVIGLKWWISLILAMAIYCLLDRIFRKSPIPENAKGGSDGG